MLLRDHFHPPISKRSSWEGFLGGWPCMIVRQLVSSLSLDFVAEPRVHLGNYYEIDVSAFEQAEDDDGAFSSARDSSTNLATVQQVALAPTITFDAEFPEQYSYEVLIFDVERERQLVAAIEIVSPANKDRPESRRLFAAKCFNLLREGVCLSIIDLVTIRQFNLYAELLGLIDRRDPNFKSGSPATYAVTCRKGETDQGTKLDVWSRALAIGEPLPSLPIWLTETLTLMLDLESSYEETCRVLRII